MTIQDLLRRFMLHCALASILWFAIALLLEKMIPGFISPFIDLPDSVGIVATIGVIALLTNPPTKTRLGRLPLLILSVIALSIMTLILWARINDVGLAGIALVGVVFLLLVGFSYAHLSKKSIAE